MKTTKKLIPAICLLLVSAILMGVSTYAWFAMNDTVGVEDTTVTIGGGAGLYFQIVAGDELFNDEVPQISAYSTYSNKELLPTKVGSAFAVNEITALVGTETTADLSALKWATAVSADAGSAEKVGNYVQVTNTANQYLVLNPETGLMEASKDNVYTLINKYRVRVNDKTGIAGATNLKVEEVKVKAVDEEKVKMLPALRLLVISSDGCVLFNADGDVVAGNTNAIIAASVPAAAADAGLEVYTYIFFDGDNSEVFTNNIAECGGFSISFNLTITLPET